VRHAELEHSGGPIPPLCRRHPRAAHLISIEGRADRQRPPSLQLAESVRQPREPRPPRGSSAAGVRKPPRDNRIFRDMVTPSRLSPTPALACPFAPLAVDLDRRLLQDVELGGEDRQGLFLGLVLPRAAAGEQRVLALLKLLKWLEAPPSRDRSCCTKGTRARAGERAGCMSPLHGPRGAPRR
jgi:hypothetical protein